MYKISIYGCAMFKKLVCQWVKPYIATGCDVYAVECERTDVAVLASSERLFSKPDGYT